MPEYYTSAHGILEAMKQRKGVLLVGRDSERSGELERQAGRCQVPVRRVQLAELDRLVGGRAHRGYALESRDSSMGRRQVRDFSALLALPEVAEADHSLVVVLDGVTDPHNLGAVLRSADLFGAQAVVVPRRRSAGKNADSLSRTSAGAVEWVPLVEVPNLVRALQDLKDRGFWVWGADMDGAPSDQVGLSGKTVLVMGREGEGLHRLIRERCDGLIRIPTGGHIDSLNVATAAGILMYETRRQQGFPC